MGPNRHSPSWTPSFPSFHAGTSSPKLNSWLSLLSRNWNFWNSQLKDWLFLKTLVSCLLARLLITNDETSWILASDMLPNMLSISTGHTLPNPALCQDSENPVFFIFWSSHCLCSKSTYIVLDLSLLTYESQQQPFAFPTFPPDFSRNQVLSVYGVSTTFLRLRWHPYKHQSVAEYPLEFLLELRPR